jgi:hypothetical protein
MDLDFQGRKLAQKAINMSKLASANAQLEAGKNIPQTTPKERKTG